MLDRAFTALIARHSRPAKLRRLGKTPSPDLETDVKIMPANDFRNKEGPSETIVEGREFVIAKAHIKAPFNPILKRGDRLIDPELGQMSIDVIQEIYDLGGSIMGFRVRTS